MAAIVLDQEEPEQEGAGRHGEQEAEQMPSVQRGPRQKPQERERRGGDGDFEDASGVARLAERSDLLQQGARI